MKRVLCALGLVLLLLPAAAAAAIKCVTAAGQVIYTDIACPGGSQLMRLRSDPQPKTVAVSEELQCAAHWLKEEDEWQRQVGLGPQAESAGVARSSFNFVRCGKYGYARPTDIS